MSTAASRSLPTLFNDPIQAVQVRRRSMVLRLFDGLLSWQDRTRQRHQLAGLDDHLLKDIGLSRADVARESAKSFWRV